MNAAFAVLDEFRKPAPSQREMWFAVDAQGVPMMGLRGVDAERSIRHWAQEEGLKAVRVSEGSKCMK